MYMYMCVHKFTLSVEATAYTSTCHVRISKSTGTFVILHVLCESVTLQFLGSIVCSDSSYSVSYFSPPASQWVLPLLALVAGEVKLKLL